MASDLRIAQRVNMAQWGKRLASYAGGAVLEIGIGGDKEIPSENFKFFPSTNYTTMDLNPEYKPDVVGDICAIPLNDSTYDLIICTQVLEHVWDTRKALSEIGRAHV